MNESQSANRRQFIKGSIATAASLVALPTLASETIGAPAILSSGSLGDSLGKPMASRLRFSVIGMNYGHVEAVTRGGGELVSFYAKEADLAAAFVKRYPQAKQVKSEAEILDDKSIQLVLSSAIPDERAPIGIRVMRAGKDLSRPEIGLH